ncbi:uncharacterized protein LOC143010700 [Genypterus blacodes]|uniref:uncharacterized protein LOC143010700 n=1 Tax=Genypterus blacodes TaxID=154954 RepID=UPI003F75D2CC
MAPTRMKLRVRRRGNGPSGTSTAAGSGQADEDEERNQTRTVHGGRKKTSSAAAPSSPPTSSASVRAAIATEDASPDSKCPICLDRFNNLAYLDRCLHRFCFPCIQEWSHNKAECPLCKQPFTSILHSVRAEDDFKEYTLRPAPENGGVTATVAIVAEMASAVRSDHQMRLMLRRHRAGEGDETTTRRRRRERGGRGGSRRAGVSRVWEWYLSSPPPPPLPPSNPPAISPIISDDSDVGEEEQEGRPRGGAELSDRGVIFEGLTGLGGAVMPLAPNDRSSRRHMIRLAARRRLQREGGTIRRLRENEMLIFRRGLYRSGIRVVGIAGDAQGSQHRDVTAESFRQNPALLHRLHPWLRRELTVLYGAHTSLIDIVQRIIMARLARHGLQHMPTIEEELRPCLLARTDHFLHELVSFARSPLSLENYDLQAVYEPPDGALELDGVSTSTDNDSVIAISEGEEDQGGGGSEGRDRGRAGNALGDVIQTGSSLSLAPWDDETPGPSYTTAEAAGSLGSLSVSPTAQEGGNEGAGQAGRPEEEVEEECLIVGYKKPIAERTPELVQLSSDSEEEENVEKKNKKEEPTVQSLCPPAAATPPLSFLPTIPPSTSSAYREEQQEKESEGACPPPPRAGSWSGSSGSSQNPVCTLSPAREQEGRRRKRKRAREQSSEGPKRSRGGERERAGMLSNPNRTIYPAMLRRNECRHSPLHSSVGSCSPSSPSPLDSTWEYRCSRLSPFSSSASSLYCSHYRSSSSSPISSSPHLPRTPPTPSLSPKDGDHHSEKPGGKRKYKSRHLNNDKDPTWRPSGDKKRGGEVERKRGRDEGRRKGRQRKDAHDGERDNMSSRRYREERSPSVEIIYEGTIAPSAVRPPAQKRRRKRHRKPQSSSCPVIITLDSDSSLDDVKNDDSGGSSPFSSRQTVDFSHLPPLSSVHSTGVGGALDGELSELPVDILDRESDNEPVVRSQEADPVAVDDSDNSDPDVDVEKVEDGGQLSGCDTDGMGTVEHNNSGCGKAKTAVNQRAAGRDVALTTKDLNAVQDRKTEMNAGKRDSDDTHLLVTILNDLESIAEPKGDCPRSKQSAHPDVKHFNNQREVSRGRSNLDDWLTEQRGVREYGVCRMDLTQGDNKDDRRQSFDSTYSSLPHPPQWPKDSNAPPLKQTSPIHSFNRDTPPPLRHNDVGGGHSLPEDVQSSPFAREPIRLASWREASGSSGDSNPITENLSVEFKLNRVIDSQCEPNDAPSPSSASTSCALAVDGSSSFRLSPVDTHSTATHGFKSGESSTGHKSPPDSSSSSGSVNRRRGVNYSQCLDFSSFLSSDLHSTHGIAEDKPASAFKSSLVESHPARFVSPVDLNAATCWSKDSTSRSCKRKTQVAPFDLHPSSGVSAKDRQASGDHFSGVTSNDASSSSLVSCVDASPQNPTCPTDSSSEAANKKRMSERALLPADGSKETLAPINSLCKGCESPTGTSERRAGDKMSPAVRPYCDSPPPVDLHSSVSAISTVEGHDAAFSCAPAENSGTASTHRTSASNDPHPNHPRPSDSSSDPLLTFSSAQTIT